MRRRVGVRARGRYDKGGLRGCPWRPDYYGKAEQAFPGEHNGQPFTHIVRRRTKCLDCGQFPVDGAYESRPDG